MNYQYQRARGYLVKLGKKLKELRRADDITPEEAAEATGMSLTTIYNIEKGAECKVSSLIVYCYYLEQDLLLRDGTVIVDVTKR